MAVIIVNVGARRKSKLSKNWLNERKEILQKIKDQVRLYLGVETEDLQRYAQSYKADLYRPWQVATMDELFVCLHQVQVVFGGDFHPFSQSQRAHLRVMRSMVGERPIVLALECIFQSDQEVLQDFMAGHLSEDEFLDKVDWYGRWGFPWSFYKPLFEFARNNNVVVTGLNKAEGERTEESLQKRDVFAAKRLKSLTEQYPDHLVYVVYGDLHIARNNLPARFKEAMRGSKAVETASLYLNSEKIYFELAAQSLENAVDLVRFDDREFCLLSSPPWVKWHSYLMYLEENFDVDLDWDEDEWESQIDHTDHVAQLVRMIGSALEAEIRTDAIEVYSMNDPQALKMIEKILNPNEFELAHSLIKNDRSFYIPKDGFFYLSKSTVNHAASLAGQYVHGQLCDRQSLLWTFPRDFLKMVWVEAMSFLLSKFINPKRKAQTMSDLKKQLEAFDKKDQGREPLLLALDHKMAELLWVYAKKDRSETFTPVKRSSYLHAARFIGEILGERYFVLYQRQILDIDNIKDLLQQDLNQKNFDDHYLEQLRLLDRLEQEG